MINAEQEMAAAHAQFWIECARADTEQGQHASAEGNIQRAIKNLMVASHGR